MLMKLLFATNNPGKKEEIATLGDKFGVEVLMLSDLGIQSDPEETGVTFQQNALLKIDDIIKNYDLPDDLWVAGDDSGAVIPALNGEPGVKTARWSGERLPVEEMVDFIMSKTAHLEGAGRKVKFVSVVALGKSDSNTEFFEGEVEGVILKEPRKDLEPIEGFPWRQVFYQPEIGKMLGEDYADNKAIGSYTHREKAFIKVFEFIGSVSQVNASDKHKNSFYPAE